MSLFDVSYLLLWTLAIVLGLVSLILLYLLAQLQERSQGGFSDSKCRLVGRKAPRVFEGAPKSPYVILALSPSCESCRKLMGELASDSLLSQFEVPLIVCCIGGTDSCESRMPTIPHAVQVIDPSDAASREFWLIGFPAAFIVNESSVVVDVLHPPSIEGLRASIRDLASSFDYDPPISFNKAIL